MKTLKTLGLIVFGLGLGLLLAEGAVRLYLALVPAPLDAPYVTDPHAAYRLRPDLPGSPIEGAGHHINSFGFRDREHPVAKPGRTYRILGIGDSFVYGAVPLSENFLKVAEARIAERLAADSLEVEMILLGLGGYSPENEVGILRGLGLALDPDLVILNFFVGNDVTGIPIRGRVCRGQIYYVGSRYWLLHLLRHSQVFRIVESRLLTPIRAALLRRQRRASRTQAGRGPAGSGRKTGRPESGSPGGLTREYLHIQKKRLPVFLARPDRNLRGLWKQAGGYLQEFGALCSQAGVPWVLHVLPTEIQVDPHVRRSVLEGLGVAEEAYDFNLPQRRLRAFAAVRGITIHDPLPELRARHRSDARLYIPNNTHWNAAGNRIAGDLLADFVLSGRRHGEF